MRTVSQILNNKGSCACYLEKPFKNVHHLVNGFLNFHRIGEIRTLKKIETKGIVVIRNIKIDDIFHAAIRQSGQNCLCEITMRIKKTYSYALYDVLNNQIFNQSCFARPRNADDI